MATIGTAFESAERIIRSMDLEFIRNVKAKDAHRLVESFYADDACVLPPNQPMVRGKHAIEGLWNAVFASGVTGLNLTTTHIEVSGDLAYGIGEYRLVVNAPDGASVEQKGKYLVAYRHVAEGDWKAVADMFSPNS